MGDPQDFPRDIEQGAAAERRLEGPDGGLVAQPLVILYGQSPISSQAASSAPRS